MWRGPEQNGISRETGLIDKWDYNGVDSADVLWKNDELGGMSTPIVLRGKLYTIVRAEPATRREGEKVVCVDANTGKKLWESRFNVYLSDVPAERIGWSCCVGDPATGRIYAMGVNGFFQCLDGETGKTIWSHSLNEEFGLLSTYGGRTNVPVLHEDLVIISAVIIGWGDMAKPAHRFLGFKKDTGEVVWFNGTSLLPKDTTYSTPIVTVLNGQAAMVFGSGDGGVWALQPRTGKSIWNFQFSMKGLNVTPVVADGIVYTGQSEENFDNPTTMGAVVAIDGRKSGNITKTGLIWEQPGMVGKSAPILWNGRLYAFDEGARLYIFDAKTGEPVGKPLRMAGAMMHSSPIYADGKLYACSRTGWNVFKITESGAKLIDKKRLEAEDEVLGSPIVSHGRIYLPTMARIYCIAKKDQPTSATPRPPAPKETPLAANDQPATVQVVPAEAVLRPGQEQAYTVRLFNARGQFLRTAKAKFTVTGPGQVSSSGIFTAPADASHTAATITANVAGLVGKARVRIVPPLPWRFTFDKGEVPVTWIGARYRHIVLDEQLLAKLTRESKRARQLYIYLMTIWTNNATEKADFNDRTPQRTWSGLLRYATDPQTGGPLYDSVTTLEKAKTEIEPALKALKRERIVADWKWSLKAGKPAPAAAANAKSALGEAQDIQLIVNRGPRRIEGNGVMTKITTIPLGTRSQGWMGPSDLHDYTIQTDVRGSEEGGKLPDVGLIAQRYTLDMMGASQQLQIRSWVPQTHTRLGVTASYPWKSETWYTMKFRASNEEGRAVLRGKVWPRGSSEPKGWTIEAIDEYPNVVGSPGLFGNATNAEVFIDNVTVTENEHQPERTAQAR